MYVCMYVCMYLYSLVCASASILILPYEIIIAIECDPRHFKVYTFIHTVHTFEYSTELLTNQAHFNRGFAYEKLDFSQEAIRDYSKAIEINGANAFTYYNRGISLDRIHQYEKACADFSQAIALQPNNIDFYHNRACCLRKIVIHTICMYTDRQIFTCMHTYIHF